MQDAAVVQNVGAADRDGGNTSTPMEKVFPVAFSGRGGEYFRIWIVNLFLSIITLGIYSAWAKVRTRRYFYAHTSIDGHPFDYLADPVNILKGHLIVGGLFIAYSVSGQFNPKISGAFVIFFYLVLPFLLYKSVRFYLHNSAYRNIRFTFDGTLWESYQLYLLAPILIPLTLGLYFPYWVYLQKRWFFENTAFGDTFNEFEASAGKFYKTYVFAILQVIALIGIFGVLFGLTAYLTGSGFDKASMNPDLFFRAGMIAVIGLYLSALFGTAIVQQYVFARITNHCWRRSRLGPVTIQSELRARRLFWIRLTNIIAIIVSLGMLAPWAKVRRMRYVTSCIRVKSAGSLEGFAAAAGKDVSAIGDAATDFFDFDIGL